MSDLEFEVGDRVWIDGRVLPVWFQGFPRNKWATIKQIKDGYALQVDGHGYHAWYPVVCLKKQQGENPVSDILPTPPKEAHVLLHLKGAAEKIDLFHYLASRLDPDWPWQKSNVWCPKLHCGTCSGAIYRLPNLTPENLRSLATQIDNNQRVSGGLKLKIKKYSVQARCSKNDPPVDQDDEPVGSSEDNGLEALSTDTLQAMASGLIPLALPAGTINILDAANEVD